MYPLINGNDTRFLRLPAGILGEASRGPDYPRRRKTKWTKTSSLDPADVVLGKLTSNTKLMSGFTRKPSQNEAGSTNVLISFGWRNTFCFCFGWRNT